MREVKRANENEKQCERQKENQETVTSDVERGASKGRAAEQPGNCKHVM